MDVTDKFAALNFMAFQSRCPLCEVGVANSGAGFSIEPHLLQKHGVKFAGVDRVSVFRWGANDGVSLRRKGLQAVSDPATGKIIGCASVGFHRWSIGRGGGFGMDLFVSWIPNPGAPPRAVPVTVSLKRAGREDAMIIRSGVLSVGDSIRINAGTSTPDEWGKCRCLVRYDRLTDEVGPRVPVPPAYGIEVPGLAPSSDPPPYAEQDPFGPYAGLLISGEPGWDAPPGEAGGAAARRLTTLL